MSYTRLWEVRMRPQGSPAELERRRLRAIELLQREIPVHVVAERLGVDRRSVRRWKRAYRGRGRNGLRARPAPGRPPKLSAAQRRQLVRVVVAGAGGGGFSPSPWGGRGGVDVIRPPVKVVYKPGHVGGLLLAAGVCPPRPRPPPTHPARHVRGPVLLVWDRGNPHKHHLVRTWLATHPRWAIVWFPPYAPELNPVELLWSYLKYGRLANFAPDTVDEIRRHVGRERRRLGRRPQFLRSFFRHSALPFRV